MTGDPAEPDRAALARAQTGLLAALVAGGPPPPDFDPHRFRAQAEALIAKRREVAARLRPDLVEAAGARFAALFDAYARANPRPVAGAHADADAFGGTMVAGRPPEPHQAREAAMTKDWRCTLGWHRFVRRHDPEPTSPSAFCLECRRCGRFRDIPWTPFG